MGPKKKKGDGSEETGKPKNSKLNKMNEMDRVSILLAIIRSTSAIKMTFR